jgi:hypothetical protein
MYEVVKIALVGIWLAVPVACSSGNAGSHDAGQSDVDLLPDANASESQVGDVIGDEETPDGARDETSVSRICDVLEIQFGCFLGVPCSSERVDPVCHNGRWTCPAGTSQTESCSGAPDGGPG